MICHFTELTQVWGSETAKKKLNLEKKKCLRKRKKGGLV